MNILDFQESRMIRDHQNITLFGPHSQLSPETFDPRKMDANFLEANFEYFRLSTDRDDENN